MGTDIRDNLEGLRPRDVCLGSAAEPFERVFASVVQTDVIGNTLGNQAVSVTDLIERVRLLETRVNALEMGL